MSMTSFKKHRRFTYKREIFYIFIYFLDLVIWFFLKCLPNSIIFRITKCKISPIPFFNKSGNRIRFRNRIRNHLLFKQNNGPTFSSCLSSTLTAKILCDLFSIKNEVHIGMLIYSDKRKTPHSWLVDPIDNFEITTKFVNDSVDTIELHKF